MSALMRWVQAWLLCGLLLAPLMGQAQALLPLPALTARVLDQTGTLTPDQRQALEEKLAAFERTKGSQVVVVMVRTTAPEDIFSYVQRLGDAWRLGRKGVGDGVLLVVAKEDRAVRIATAKAVEGAIPDVVAGRIIEQAIKPRFKEGDFAGGLEAGVTHILARLQGEELPLPLFDPAEYKKYSFWAFAPCLAFLLQRAAGFALGSVIAAVVVAPVVWVYTHVLWQAIAVALGAVLLAPLMPTLLQMGLVFSGGRGGGFSSGGGGKFGGGGASGRW